MAAFSNTMTITNSALSSICRELIDKRVYKKDSINFVGTPTVISGTASNLSSENFFEEDISLSSSCEITEISFQGDLMVLQDEDICCAWNLAGEGVSLGLFVTPTTVYLKSENNIIIELSNINNSEERIKCSVKISEALCSIEYIVNKIRYSTSVELENPLPISSYTKLYVGADGKFDNLYFKGNIDLPSLIIYQDKNIIYSPSIENSFNFTTLLVSDGSYPLDDSSSPILNHIFSFPIKEISRTGNNLLLTTTISEDAKLTIREIGLYCADGEGTYLFSKISNLNLDKGTDLDYDLIINIKLDINVVNTVAFPKFIVTEPEYPSLADFNKIKNTYLYSVTNLERMIKDNAIGVGNYVDKTMDIPVALEIYYTNKEGEKILAPFSPQPASILGVGFNAPQTYCAYQDSITSWEDNYGATSNLAHLRNYLVEPVSERRFDESLINTEGSVHISDSGLAQVSIGRSAYVDPSMYSLVILTPSTYILETCTVELDESFYVQNNILFNGSDGAILIASFDPIYFNKWDVNMAFITSSSTDIRQTILDFKIESEPQVLLLTIENDYCHLNVQSEEAILVHNTMGTGRSGNVNEETETFNILTEALFEEDTLSILLDEGFFIDNGILYDTDDKIIICKKDPQRHTVNDNVYFSWSSEKDSYTFYTTDMHPTVNSLLYSQEGEELSTANIEEVFSGPILDTDLFKVEMNTRYNIKVLFDGHSYKVFYSTDDEDLIQILDFISSRRIGRIGNVVFGAEYTLDGYTNCFLGTLPLNDFELNFYNYSSHGELIERTNYIFNSVFTIPGYTITDFYHIPTYNHSYFLVNNLCSLTPNSYLEILENYLKGRHDQINFNQENGYSLSMKVDLIDRHDKILLAKGDLETENFYFIFKQENNTLVFEYYTGNYMSPLSYEIPEERFSEFLNYPSTYTFTITGEASPTISLYKDNELLSSRQVGNKTSLNASDYYLTNKITADAEEYNFRIVKDIIGIDHALNSEQIYYLNTMLNTNF